MKYYGQSRIQFSTYIVLYLCYLAAFLSCSTTNADLVINFDTFPDGTAVPSGTEITNQFIPLGVSFHSPDHDSVSGPKVWDGGPGSPISPQSVSPPNVLVAESGPFGSLVAKFLLPVSEINWTWTTVGSSEFTGTAFGVTGAMLDMVSVTGPIGNGVGNNVVSTLRAPGDLIHSVRFAVTRLDPEDGYAIDDFSFVRAVPEPSTIGFIGLGALGMALKAWRRRRLRRSRS